jgi:hypothetical protein
MTALPMPMLSAKTSADAKLFPYPVSPVPPGGPIGLYMTSAVGVSPPAFLALTTQ